MKTGILKNNRQLTLLLLFAAFLIPPHMTLAQAQPATIVVSGTVIDDSDSQTVPGVSILDAQRKSLGTTDVNGKFTIRVQSGATVVFSSIGYTSINLEVSANGYDIIVRLNPSTSVLQEVVVTALGIKREEKALGYSVTTIRNKELTDAISNNWTNALTGKVAGLNLIKSGGGPAGSNKIILRGESNLTGDNSALIVVDGVVISGSSGRSSNPGTANNNGAYLQGDSPTDFGNSLADINPDDIETVSVLKGPAASALYGLRASNGAIIITTKSGRPNNKGLGISFNSNTFVDRISRWPDYQSSYGQGAVGQDLYYSYLATADGASTRSTSSAWGPKFNGQNYFQYDPVTRTTSATRLPWVAYPDNHKEFFQTGRTYINSLSLDGGNNSTSARLSLTNLKNDWIIPNTGYSRNTVALSVSSKINNRLQIASKLNYTNKAADNLPSTGYNNQSIMYFIRGLTPNMNMDWFREYWLPGQEGISQTRPFSSLLDNPFLIANEMLNKSNRSNVIGNVSATYNFMPNLSLMVRTSADLSYEERSQQRPKSTNKFADGSFRTQELYNQEITSDFLLRFNSAFAKRFTYNLTAGGSHLRNRYTKNELRADKLLYPDVYTIANAKVTPVSLPYRSQYIYNSFYGLGSLSYDNFLFMDVTARNDWVSTLATPVSTDNVSFFYPSVSLSAVLSEKIKFPSVFDLVKLRGSFAGTGSGGTVPYRTSYTYNSTLFSGSLSNPSSVANPGLKPQYTKSLEFGTDVRMFANRLGIDLAVYRNNTSDQILESPVDKASGYSSVILNAGLVRNEGVELAANGTPVMAGNFKWMLNGTFSANRNKVLSLADSVNTLVLATGPRGTIEARPGGSFGAIYGLGYERSPDGQIVYSGGYPVMSTDAKYIGNANPKFKGSMGTSLSYKKVTLSVLFDGQWGAVGYSLTSAVLSEEGKLNKTVPGRYNGITGNGVIRNPDGSYSQNTVTATSIQAYYNAHFNRDNVESNTFSTDFIKFRETRLDYGLTPGLLKTLRLQRATIGVYGRDLFMWTKWPSFDPEFGTLGGDGEINAGFESAQFPSTRTFGINLTIGI